MWQCSSLGPLLIQTFLILLYTYQVEFEPPWNGGEPIGSVRDCVQWYHILEIPRHMKLDLLVQAISCSFALYGHHTLELSPN